MEDEKDVEREDAQIIGRTEGPFGSDDADADLIVQDNKNRDVIENSANGLDSVQVRGGQDGRNNRGFGGIDMDGKNGVLRMGDQDDSEMQVTDEGASNAAADKTLTKTAMVDVTTSGPDDYASADKVGVPNAQKAAKEQNDADEDETITDEKEQTEREEDVAETGTDLNNQPSY
jgi:glutamate synthase domain-containing protein 1